MRRTPKHKSPPSAAVGPVPLWFRVAEGALLAVILAVAVLRVTFIETPHIEPTTQTTPLSNEAVSVLIASVFWAALAIWLMLGAAAGRLRWRPSSVAKAVGVFCVFGVIGACLASDKRAALTDLFVMLSAPAAGLLALQLLDSRETVRLFLWLLLAVGAVTTYACYDKISSSHDMLIREYERDPDAILERLSIEPGSLSHWHYEHRLYSRDVSGFLTTSNSTGSLLLLPVFAGLGLCVEAFAAKRRLDKDRSKTRSEQALVTLICVALATAVAAAGLLMTQSKGAVGAFILFVPILTVCLWCGDALRTHWRAAVTVLGVCALAATMALMVYGLRHGRLPGGNSMLVRWQYWVASVEMAKESPVLGVGGGNYAAHYLTHKDPAAPETIGDPHNWVFSLLCRFGVVGLAAMGFAMLRPVGRLFASVGRFAAVANAGDAGSADKAPPYAERFLWPVLLAAVMAAMLLIRPGLFDLDTASASAAEWSAALLLLIMIPAGIVAVVFGLLRFACAGDPSLHRPNPALMTALACGLAAVLLHNLVDFAIFEPGVWTWFWLTAAAGLALRDMHNAQSETRTLILTGNLYRALGVLLPAVVLAAAVLWVIAPPVRRGVLTYQAARAVGFEQARTVLDKAVAADTLSPEAARFGARLLLHHSTQRAAADNKAILLAAERFALTAIARNPHDPRPRHLLTDIYQSAAEQADDPASKQAFRQQAFEALQQARQRYPGSDRINYRLGILAEQLGQPKQAIGYLEAALRIETRYREQFRVMYPDRQDVISRLGPANYQDLLERLGRLEQSDAVNRP